MTQKLTVHKKAYYVRGHYSHSKSGKRIWIKPHNVSSSTYKINDLGAPGRGPKTLPKPKKGGLGGQGFLEKPYETQKKIVFGVAKRRGEKTAMGRLSLLAGYNKRHPKKKKRLLKLKSEVAGSFIGKKKVKYPQGYSKNMKRKRR